MTSMISPVGKKILPGRCFQLFGAVLVALMLSGCGGGSPSNQPQTTGLKKRVLLSNQQTGSVTIMDASRDTIAGSLTVFGAQKMVTAGGATAILQTTQPSFSVFNNSTEQIAQTPTLGDFANDIAVAPDGKTVYAAVHNLGQVVITTSDGAQSAVNVPNVSRIVLSPNGTKLLAFSQNPNALAAPNTGGFFVIDTANKTVTGITNANLDQPFSAVFNNSETQAFILSCGAECGGTAANVMLADFTNPAAPTFSAKVPVSGATVGLLNAGSLFVAGTPVGSVTGTFQTITTSSLTASAPLAITNGQHLKMRLTSSNRVYVGAVTCTPVNNPVTGGNRGCLSIVNINSGAVVLPEFPSIRSQFDVTGIQPISNRNVIYVCEGGELDIYDINLDVLAPTQVDIVGRAFDVVQIDP